MSEGDRATASARVVLVVEDDPLIRLLAVELLRESGLTVHQASNACSALRMIESEPEIDTLVTDISMPIGMNGVQLAQHARATRPDIRVVITSGARRPQSSDIPKGGFFVPKPYEPAHVLAALGAPRAL